MKKKTAILLALSFLLVMWANARTHSSPVAGTSPEKISDRTSILQNVCTPGKISQKWAMTQTGDNLEIRDVQNNRCLDIWNKLKVNYTPVTPQRCNNGTNQRWTLHKTTLNNDNGIICSASPSHPAHDCSGVNDQQKQIYLGKTLTKGRCEEACKTGNLSGCKWEASRQKAVGGRQTAVSRRQ